jgi:molybdate transport system ATP-binding protein
MEKCSAAIPARVLRHDTHYGLTVLQFSGGEMKIPGIDEALGTGVSVAIEERDVAIALSRPMDVSITNRLPGSILAIEPLDRPYVRVRIDLGGVVIASLVTSESVDRLGLEVGLGVWAMIKSVAIGREAVRPEDLPPLRPWPSA